MPTQHSQTLQKILAKGDSDLKTWGFSATQGDKNTEEVTTHDYDFMSLKTALFYLEALSEILSI